MVLIGLICSAISPMFKHFTANIVLMLLSTGVKAKVNRFPPVNNGISSGRIDSVKYVFS